MKHILSISYDQTVLSTRGLLLEGEGYRVTSALNLEVALEAIDHKGPFDLVILGHSIPNKDKVRVTESFRSHGSALIISLYWPGEVAVKNADIFVDLGECPSALVKAVKSACPGDTDPVCK